MEITPFKTTIPFKQYIELVKPKTNSIGISEWHYALILDPPIIEYYEDTYYITGYHSNNINLNITCVLTRININNNYKEIYIDADLINVTVEVVLKEELKDIKTVEQTKLFDNEQRKD